MRAHGAFSLFTVRGGAGALIYYQRASEPETARFIKRFLKPGMVFVDIGAHLGEYTILASKLVRPSGWVLAFEPRPDVFLTLQQNLRLNECRNVGLRQEAVWDESGLSDFELTAEPSVSALLTDRAKWMRTEVIQVRTVPLDHCFPDPRAVSPHLIKIDVEGAELHVLKGGRTLLAQPSPTAPVIIFEYEPGNSERFGYAAYEIVTFLREMGYSIYDYRRAEPVLVDGYPLLAKMGLRRNLIAAKVPPSRFPELLA